MVDVWIAIVYVTLMGFWTVNLITPSAEVENDEGLFVPVRIERCAFTIHVHHGATAKFSLDDPMVSQSRVRVVETPQTLYYVL